MKTKFIVLFLFITTAAIAQTVPVKLAWDQTASGVTNYTLYASQSATFTNNLSSASRYEAGTSLTATATVTAGTRWFYTVTAWKEGQESKPSNVVSYIAPSPTPAPNLTVTFVLPPGATVTSTNNNIIVTFP